MSRWRGCMHASLSEKTVPMPFTSIKFTIPTSGKGHQYTAPSRFAACGSWTPGKVAWTRKRTAVDRMFPQRMGLSVKKIVFFWCSFGRKRWCVMVCPYKVSQDFIYSLYCSYSQTSSWTNSRYHPRRLSFPIHIYRFASDFWKRKTNSRTWWLTTVISQRITFNKSRNGHCKIQQFIPIPGTQMTQGLVIYFEFKITPPQFGTVHPRDLWHLLESPKRLWPPCWARIFQHHGSNNTEKDLVSKHLIL